jgi:hypothetical protein
MVAWLQFLKSVHWVGVPFCSQSSSQSRRQEVAVPYSIILVARKCPANNGLPRGLLPRKWVPSSSSEPARS